MFLEGRGYNVSAAGAGDQTAEILSWVRLDEVGECDLTLEFVRQRYQWFPFSLSGLAFGDTCVALAGCVVRKWRREQSTRRWVRAQDPMDGPDYDC